MQESTNTQRPTTEARRVTIERSDSASESKDPEAAWFVLAHWTNSSPTLHGGFTYAADADSWAGSHLDSDRACTSWKLLILSPVVAEQVAR